SVGSLIFTDPICFIGSKLIATIPTFVPRHAAIRTKTRGHNDSVVQPVGQESGGKCGPEMVVRVAQDSMHKNKCTGDVFVPCVEGMRSVDQNAQRLPHGLDPLSTI